jgi:xanthine dehydrogenase iron-sulfur cluster and FAD-binding subunit A
VNAAFLLTHDASFTIQSAGIFYGGLIAGVLRASKTESVLVGRTLTQQATLSDALNAVHAEAVPDPAFGRTQYRQLRAPQYDYFLLLGSFFFLCVLVSWFFVVSC